MTALPALLIAAQARREAADRARDAEKTRNDEGKTE